MAQRVSQEQIKAMPRLTYGLLEKELHLFQMRDTLFKLFLKKVWTSTKKSVLIVVVQMRAQAQHSDY